jgi:hypothetical protein
MNLKPIPEIDALVSSVKNLKPIKNAKQVLAVEKRKATIKAKRDAKEAKKKANEEKFMAKHNDIFSKIKDDANKTPYAKVIKAISKDHKDINFFNTGARYKNRDVFCITLTKHMSQPEILDIANKVSSILGTYDDEGLIDLSVRGSRWYYQGQASWGSRIQFRDDYDELEGNSFDKMALYISAMPKSKGGASYGNDCLYVCLYEILQSKLIKLFPKPADMKRFLKLGIHDKVPLSSLEQLETKINCSINVTGDYTYTTKLQSNKVINLKLINEHYTIDDKKADTLKVNCRISRRDRKIMMYDRSTFTGYDGENIFPFTKEFKHQIYNWQTNYILVELIDEKKTIQENYESFIMIANTLKEKTNGKINLYRTGSYQITAKYLFSEMTKHIINPDNIDQVEAEFIDKASQGAIYFTTKEYEGQGYKADIKSMYPSLLKSTMLFPLKKGELKYLKELNDIYLNGIYRCIIHGSTKLFRFNRDNYYTSIDLNLAKELNLKIDLIIDDKPNFLYYSRDKCLTGSEIFGEYVNFLFPLKNQDIKGAKMILNTLWGKLSQKDEHNFIHNNKNKVYIPDDVKPTFKPYNDDSTSISTIKYNHYYKYGWARIMPFLIAKGRSVISKIMTPYIDRVVRCHTDGILFSEEPKGIKYGSDIGDLVFEGYYKNVYINSSGKLLYSNL